MARLLLLLLVLPFTAPLNTCDTAALMEAVTDANATPGTQTITLNAACTYTLSETILITDDVIIVGNGATLDGAAVGGAGHTLEILLASTVSMTELTITRAAGHGIVSRGDLTLRDSTLSNNTNHGLMQVDGTATLRNVTLTRNGGDGAHLTGVGALHAVTATYNQRGLVVMGSAQVSTATLTHNVDGGLHLIDTADVTLTNGLIAHNAGVAALDTDFTATVEVLNSTIATNTAAALNIRGTGIMHNSIVWGNGSFGSAPSLLGEHNIAQGGTFGTAEDPQLDDDLRLTPTSPAIDAGDAALLPADWHDANADNDTSEALPLDHDATPRLENGVLDLGAYELAIVQDASATFDQQPHTVTLAWRTTATPPLTIERRKPTADTWLTLATDISGVPYVDASTTCDQTYEYRIHTAEATTVTNAVFTDCAFFADVPSPNQPPAFEAWINDFARAGITTGCGTNAAGDLIYCPEVAVSRGAMAVFILRALNYPDLPYSPTGTDPNPFSDVPSPNQPPPFEAWIEEFYTLGITTGCNNGTPTVDLRYCPEVAVNRGQMAVFILRALEGADYVPSRNPDQTFTDVPSPNQPPAFEAWIEEFYNRGITTGCNNNPLRYCPETTVDRGQMAVFILRAFDDIPNPNHP